MDIYLNPALEGAGSSTMIRYIDETVAVSVGTSWPRGPNKDGLRVVIFEWLPVHMRFYASGEVVERYLALKDEHRSDFVFKFIMKNMTPELFSKASAVSYANGVQDGRAQHAKELRDLLECR